MKIALFTDIHGRTSFIKSVAEDLKNSDLVIISGDITHFGNTVAAKGILGAFSNYNAKLVAVSGNCDLPETESLLSSGNIQAISGINFFFLGGSLITPAKTPNEHYESYYEQILAGHEKELNDSNLPLVLVSHQPPYDTINDRLSSNLHVGSKSIRRFIERFNPIACFTGHIHEGKGVDNIGETIIINPGPFSDGFYAMIEIPFTPCEVRCQLKQAQI